MCTDAPTLGATIDENNKFYDALYSIISSIPGKEALFITGTSMQERVLTMCLGLPSLLIMEWTRSAALEEFWRFLQFCAYHKPAVTNTFFQLKNRPKKSRSHPRSKHQHQLDVVVTRQSDLNNVLNIRSTHIAQR